MIQISNWFTGPKNFFLSCYIVFRVESRIEDCQILACALGIYTGTLIQAIVVNGKVTS